MDQERAAPLRALNFFGCGLAMGAADAVPGVSGGTIALILGIYERFIEALATVVRAPIGLVRGQGVGELKKSLGLLVPLGLGVVVAYYVATKLLVGKGDEQGWLQRADTAPLCYGFFFGLVLASLREPWRRIREHGLSIWIAAAAGAAVALIFTGLPYAQRDPETWMLLFGGALAICVMLLPGVSGSLLLLILGQYQAVVEAVHDRDLGRVGVFLLGIALGIGGFVPLLRRLLRTRHDVTMAALAGLMAGSLRALWPWKTQYDPKKDVMTNVGIGDDLGLVLAAAAAGGLVILMLTTIERRLQSRLAE